MGGFDINEFALDLPSRVEHKEDLDMLLRQLTEANGSDIFLMGGVEPKMSRYGRKYNLGRRRISETEVARLIGVIYNENAIAKINGSAPINCTYEFFVNKEDESKFAVDRFRFRVNAVHCVRNGRSNITVTLRSIPSIPPDWRKSGVEEVLIDKILTLKQGLICVVGATGNGKSTLLASMLRARLEDPEAHTNLVTIEHPVEFVYDAVKKPTSFVTPIEVGLSIGSFAQGVENSLRMAPDLILIGESRDFETTQASLQAAMTGHGVMTTVHANSAPETFQRLIYTYPKELQSQAKIDIVQPMDTIIAQRLVQKVGGGRVALREILFVDQRDKEILLEADNMSSAAFKLLHSGRGRPFIEDAESKYKEGIISDHTIKLVRATYAQEKKGF
ncbi:type IV pilus twitching motility protein PilT [Pseudomonas aeruginosa]